MNNYAWLLALTLDYMAFLEHARAQWGGRLAGLASYEEIWTNTLALGSGAEPGGHLSDPQAYADNVAGALHTWFTTGNHMATGATLDFLKVNNIDAAGHYVDAVTHQHNYSAPDVGSSSGVAPAFCSVAYTWETGALRGYAHRGRIYPPNYTYAPGGSRISSTDATAALASAIALLTVWTTELDDGADVHPIVASSHGVLKTITGASVDNIYDVQRRRKNRLVPVRVSGSF